ncbi:MAG: alpha/beta fold hydrolase [Acidimicrobiales bacterium]|jgi:pimeloyl-ACP methyl ester carboxylesterase
MPEVDTGGATIAYDVFGDGEPVVLVAGCGQPALAWRLSAVPVLTAAGYQVVTFDNRGVSPSSSPPAPYSIDAMAADTIGLLDHLDMGSVRIAGHSMGGWVAESLAIRHPDRIRGAVFMGSCNEGTAWEMTITTVERDLARLDYVMPSLYEAAETLRYLPNHELQDDAVVEAWLTVLEDQPAWPNPGRLGQYEACLAWSADRVRTEAWSTIPVPCLIMAFEHDIDSPPARARQAAARIPGARYVEIAGASHLGIFTHGPEVGSALVEFFSGV